MVLVGVGAIAFRRPLARVGVKSQNYTWGFRFGEREVRMSELGVIVVGISAVIFGVLSALGILR